MLRVSEVVANVVCGYSLVAPCDLANVDGVQDFTPPLKLRRYNLDFGVVLFPRLHNGTVYRGAGFLPAQALQ